MNRNILKGNVIFKDLPFKCIVFCHWMDFFNKSVSLAFKFTCEMELIGKIYTILHSKISLTTSATPSVVFIKLNKLLDVTGLSFQDIVRVIKL